MSARNAKESAAAIMLILPLWGVLLVSQPSLGAPPLDASLPVAEAEAMRLRGRSDAALRAFSMPGAGSAQPVRKWGRLQVLLALDRRTEALALIEELKARTGWSRALALSHRDAWTWAWRSWMRRVGQLTFAGALGALLLGAGRELLAIRRASMGVLAATGVSALLVVHGSSAAVVGISGLGVGLASLVHAAEAARQRSELDPRSRTLVAALVFVGFLGQATSLGIHLLLV